VHGTVLGVVCYLLLVSKLIQKVLGFLKPRWLRCLLVVSLLALAAAAGLRSVGWLSSRLGVMPPKLAILQTPSPDYLAGVEKMIEGAKEEILIAAPRIDDEALLKSLAAAEARGVRVVLVFSKDQVSTNAGCLGWLMHHKACRVFADSAPFTGVTFVMDRNIALVSAVPLTVKAKASQFAGTAIFIRHRDAVGDLRDNVRRRAERGLSYR
jgi:hypothetical protein